MMKISDLKNLKNAPIKSPARSTAQRRDQGCTWIQQTFCFGICFWTVLNKSEENCRTTRLEDRLTIDIWQKCFALQFINSSALNFPCLRVLSQSRFTILVYCSFCYCVSFICSQPVVSEADNLLNVAQTCW